MLDEQFKASNKYFIWRDACLFALSCYRQLLGELEADAPEGLKGTERKKWARQAVRSVLPNCTETKIMLTGNLRAWRGTILQRASRHADDEIRWLFNVIYNVLSKEAPHCFADMRTESLPDGTFEVLK